MRASWKYLAPLALAALLPLAACDKEADQAKAFADLLQNRILDRPGVHIPLLSDEERDKIGHYADDLAILKGFNDDLDATSEKFGKAMHAAPSNVAPLDLPKFRPDLVAARDFFPGAAAGIGAALAKAEGLRANLHQPDAVKVKYDAAFEQMVTRPAKALRDIVPLAATAIDSEIEVADFIETHKAGLKVVGGKLATSKPDLRKQLDALYTVYVERFAKVQAARRELELAVQGR